MIDRVYSYWQIQNKKVFGSVDFSTSATLTVGYEVNGKLNFIHTSQEYIMLRIAVEIKSSKVRVDGCIVPSSLVLLF